MAKIAASKRITPPTNPASLPRFVVTPSIAPSPMPYNIDEK